MDPDYIRDIFSVFGPVEVRRMFGGAGVYAGGVMFALTHDGQIYLKADAASAPAFESEGSRPFEYRTKAGKRGVMSYWRLPDRLYDDPDELAQWARRALAVAQSTRTTKGGGAKSAHKPAAKAAVKKAKKRR